MLLRNLLSREGGRLHPRPESRRAPGLRRRVRVSELPTASTEVPDGQFAEALAAEAARSEVGVRDHSYVHVSELVSNFCGRRTLLMDRYGIEHHVSRPGAQVTFALGRAIERHVRELLINHYGVQRFVGRWECLCGDVELEESGEPDADDCPRCGEAPHFYRELTLHLPAQRVLGNPDMIFVCDDGYYLPIEIKSMARNSWRELQRPVVEHQLQVLMYRRMLEGLGHPTRDYGVVIYVCKDHVGEFNRPYKEFRAEQATWGGHVEDMLRRAQETREARDRGELVPRICENDRCTMARSCPAAHLCFGVDE